MTTKSITRSKWKMSLSPITRSQCSRTSLCESAQVSRCSFEATSTEINDQGGIFALLGSNGCGKTTLLKLILGQAEPKSGTIRVYGLEPGHSSSDIPGRGVGYMPQEIALFEKFTIKECLHYFGKIYDMNPTLIDHRIALLIELLYLPPMDKKICDLSGGQKRLVSMAVTIIHRPKLLILDEPTVGVDSILRCRIWSYLESIAKNYGNEQPLVTKISNTFWN